MTPGSQHIHVGYAAREALAHKERQAASVIQGLRVKWEGGVHVRGRICLAHAENTSSFR